MPGHYSYDFKNLATQGSNPKQPVFTNPFAYRPQVAVMEAYEADNNSPLPTPAILMAAKEQATKIRDKKVTYPFGLEERTYEGVDHDYMAKSKELTKEAESMTATEIPTFFDDFLTAEFYRGALRPNKRIEDSTIPKSVAAMKLHVDLLVRCFKSTERCDDNEPMIRPFRDRRHDSKIVECLCWNIVKACIFRAKSDEPLLTAYEPYKARNSHGLDNFEKRFDAIAISLARSKTICKHLYDAPYINTFVDDPLRSIRRVDANRDLNKQKAGIMAKGKALQDQEEASTGVAPAKKTRRSRKRTASEANEDYEGDGAQVHTPLTAQSASSRMASSLPTHGRVTRRTSRLLAEAQSSSFSPPSSLRSQMVSSPLSSEIDIKDESSPLQHQSYAMNGHGPNGVRAMDMHLNGFDNGLMQGINFPGRFPAPMAVGYGYGGMMGRNGYVNSMQLNFMSMPPGNTSVPFRNGPMQPEEITMSGPNRYPSINPFAEEDAHGGEDDE